ncbi:MAG: hypothetical protein ACK595_18795, partial [Planctomycetota bacterium]
RLWSAPCPPGPGGAAPSWGRTAAARPARGTGGGGGGASPLTVHFTSTSVRSAPGGITGYAWDFDGDTVVDSTLPNPIRSTPESSRSTSA